MPLLYYWRRDTYARDRSFGFGYHLNQNSSRMVTVSPGDSLWAFTQRRDDGLYVLAAELVVQAVTRNPPDYRYGLYRVWGDLKRSRYFDIDLAPNVEPHIRPLSIHPQGVYLGQAFQGPGAVRELTEMDHLELAAFARDLPTLDHVGIYPEDEAQARLVYGADATALVLREDAATYGRRLEYLRQMDNA